MTKTITHVYVKPLVEGHIMPMQSVQYVVAEDGYIPAMLVEYYKGHKYLCVILGSGMLSFVNKKISFQVEEFMWNKIFEKWDKTSSGKFFSNALNITNEFLVRESDGKWKEELTEAELIECGVYPEVPEGEEAPEYPEPTQKLIGEYDFWMKMLGKTAIIPPLLLSAQKKF